MHTKILATVAATLLLAAGAATAQTPSPDATGPYTDTTVAPAVPVEDNDGMDWGWIGLLGLAGLFGLRKRPDDARPVSTTARH